MEPLLLGLQALADPSLLLLLVIATLGGVVIGALPGLNATTGAALLLPFTLTMEPIPAIAILTAIYCSATFAGAITAILINTPGTSASATTCLDGYPLAMRGEAGRALGLAVVSSTVGGVLSVFCLMLAAPLLARAAYHFSPPESEEYVYWGAFCCGNGEVKRKRNTYCYCICTRTRICT